MKKALVTGADRGLGLGLVKILLERDYTVFAGNFLVESTELASLSFKNKGKLWIIKLDISDDESVRQASEQIRMQTEYIDILINNAGILGDVNNTIMDKLDFEEIQHVLNANAVGPLRVTNALIEQVLKSKAKTVVNISSEAGSIGQNYRDSWFGYSMSKAALNMGGALIHKRIATLGGRVIQMHPGWIKSYMSGTLNTKADLEPEHAASKILNVVEGQLELPIGELPVFVDSDGNKMPW